VNRQRNSRITRLEAERDQALEAARQATLFAEECRQERDRLTAALVDKARVFSHPDADLGFLALEFEEMFAFSTFIIAGLLWRKDMAAHKRLMILAAVSISDAGFGRVWQMGFKVVPPGPLGWWVQFFWGIALLLIAMMAWDLWRRRRIHPAVLFGAAVPWGGEAVATTLYFTPAWTTAMTGLVRAWGYAG